MRRSFDLTLEKCRKIGIFHLDLGARLGGQMGVRVKEKIIEIITEILQVPEGTVTESTRIEDLEEWDSLAQVLIIGELESRLGIVIPLEDAEEMTGVADFLARL